MDEVNESTGIHIPMETTGNEERPTDHCASGLGAPHIRQRLFWVADRQKPGLAISGRAGRVKAKQPRLERGGDACGLANPQRDRLGPRRPECEGFVGESASDDASSTCGLADTPDDNRRPGKCGTQTGVGPEGIGRRGSTSGGSDGWVADTEQHGHQGRRSTGEGQPNFWANSILIPCADGKWRRVPGRVVQPDRTGPQPGSEAAERTGHRHSVDPASGRVGEWEIEPALFPLLLDGVSALLGAVWDEGIYKTEQEVIRYAKESEAGPGKILRALWCETAKKTLREKFGRHGAFSETEILLIALCKLQGNPKQTFGASTQNIAEIQEGSVRILWACSSQIATPSCPSHQRGLDGPPTGEFDNPLRWLLPETASETNNILQGLRRKGQGTWPLFEALSALEKIWRSALDEKGGRERLLSDCQGWSDGLTVFPLSAPLPGRVGLLKGAGNAIVPQVAAEFIRAFVNHLTQA